MKKSLYIIALFLLPYVSDAQKSESFIFQLVDKNYETLSYFTYAIFQHNDLITGGTSDWDGIIEVELNEKQELRLMTLGYEEKRFTFDDLQETDLVMVKDGIYMMDEVVVRAKGLDNQWGNCCWDGMRINPQKIVINSPPTTFTKWSYYPNPTTDFVRIEPQNKKGFVVLYASNGMEVRRKAIYDQSILLSLQDLPSGGYRLQFQNEKEFSPIGQLMVSFD